jgi:hypothetical protein
MANSTTDKARERAEALDHSALGAAKSRRRPWLADASKNEGA